MGDLEIFSHLGPIEIEKNVCFLECLEITSNNVKNDFFEDESHFPHTWPINLSRSLTNTKSRSRSMSPILNYEKKPTRFNETELLESMASTVSTQSERSEIIKIDEKTQTPNKFSEIKAERGEQSEEEEEGIIEGTLPRRYEQSNSYGSDAAVFNFEISSPSSTRSSPPSLKFSFGNNQETIQKEENVSLSFSEIWQNPKRQKDSNDTSDPYSKSHSSIIEKEAIPPSLKSEPIHVFQKEKLESGSTPVRSLISMLLSESQKEEMLEYNSPKSFKKSDTNWSVNKGSAEDEKVEEEEEEDEDSSIDEQKKEQQNSAEEYQRTSPKMPQRYQIGNASSNNSNNSSPLAPATNVSNELKPHEQVQKWLQKRKDKRNSQDRTQAFEGYRNLSDSLQKLKAW